jgi:hypothetical protein
MPSKAKIQNLIANDSSLNEVSSIQIDSRVESFAAKTKNDDYLQENNLL